MNKLLTVVKNTDTQTLVKVGDAAYFGGTSISFISGLMLMRKMAKSDLGSAWTLRPTPWLKLMRQHKGISAVYVVFYLVAIVGTFLRGPQVQLLKFDPEALLKPTDGVPEVDGDYLRIGEDGELKVEHVESPKPTVGTLEDM